MHIPGISLQSRTRIDLMHNKQINKSSVKFFFTSKQTVGYKRCKPFLQNYSAQVGSHGILNRYTFSVQLSQCQGFLYADTTSYCWLRKFLCLPFPILASKTTSLSLSAGEPFFPSLSFHCEYQEKSPSSLKSLQGKGNRDTELLNLSSPRWWMLLGKE